MEDEVVMNLAGYYENREYPPDTGMYGTRYGGYKTNNEEVLFKQFAVQGYDVSFSYKGKEYYLRYDGEDGVAVTDSNFEEEIVKYPSANTLIRQYMIDGMPLKSIIDKLENMEIW